MQSQQTNSPSNNVSVRLVLDVTYSLHGESAANMAARLEDMCARAYREGILTGDTEAEIEKHSVCTVVLPEPLSETQVAAFMRQRIESGDLGLEDVPVRLARYGLMEPHAFVDEVRERIDLAKQDL